MKSRKLKKKAVLVYSAKPKTDSNDLSDVGKIIWNALPPSQVPIFKPKQNAVIHNQGQSW